MSNAQHPTNTPVPVDRDWENGPMDEYYYAHLDSRLNLWIEAGDTDCLFEDPDWVRPIEEFEGPVERVYSNMPVHDRNLEMIKSFMTLMLIAEEMNNLTNFKCPRYMVIRALALKHWRRTKSIHEEYPAADLWNYVDEEGGRIWHEWIVWAAMQYDGATVGMEEIYRGNGYMG